jgi:hypothetical protein
MEAMIHPNSASPFLWFAAANPGSKTTESGFVLTQLCVRQFLYKPN